MSAKALHGSAAAPRYIGAELCHVRSADLPLVATRCQHGRAWRRAPCGEMRAVGRRLRKRGHVDRKKQSETGKCGAHENSFRPDASRLSPAIGSMGSRSTHRPLQHGGHAKNLGVLEFRRFAAARGAVAAARDAILHLAKPLAIRCAHVTDVGAKGTDAIVKLAFVREQIRGRGADGRTIEHQPNVLRSGMLAAELETMRHHHRQAGGVAAHDGVHARMHLLAEPVRYFRHRK